MLVTFGQETKLRLEHKENAPKPMVVTFGQETELRSEQPSNASEPMVVMCISVIVNDVILVPCVIDEMYLSASM